MKYPALLTVTAIVLLLGIVRWTKPDFSRLSPWKPKTIYVTNWMNPESITLPHKYFTNTVFCNSENYRYWIFMITNETDRGEIRQTR